VWTFGVAIVTRRHMGPDSISLYTITVAASPSLHLNMAEAGEWGEILLRPSSDPRPSNDPSKLAHFSSLGRARMLVYVRPSTEALLRACIPGAQNQRG